MHELYELKEMLCKELEDYGKKGEMSTGTLDVVDKLAHTVKNLDKIIESYDEEGYSGDSYRGGSSYRDGRNYGSYRDGGSYARGRGARRDSMGRYSRASEDTVEQLRELMDDAPENMRQEIQRLVNKLDKM